MYPIWKYLGQQEVLRIWFKKSHIRNNFALILYPLLLVINTAFQLFLHLRMPLAIFSQFEVFVKENCELGDYFQQIP